MNQEIKRLAGRATAALSALGLGVALTVSSLLAPGAQLVNALTSTGGQVQSRSIYMSSSTPSATASYYVTFKAATTGSVQGLVVDFCANDPIIGDTCTASTGFSIGASPSVNYTIPTYDPSSGATALPGTWTASSSHSNRTLKLSNGSGATLTAGTLYGFTINGVTNPDATNTSSTFYARLVTYATNGTDFTNYDGAAEGTVVDYGGFALSTANIINITAKVQETLSFCVTSVDLGPGGNQCGGATATAVGSLPNLIIGHGTPVATINEQAVDRTPAYMQVSTNATTGAVIRMHSTNTCPTGGLSATGGANCLIPGVSSVGGNSATTANTMVPGTAAFGLFVGNGYTTTGVTTSAGTIRPTTPYHDNSAQDEATPNLKYGMDNTTGSGVTGTYGSLIADTNNLPCNTMNSHLVFAATAGLTTPAGIYTTSESLIATGTF